MARKIKPPDDKPSMAWLMSFGDTMTTLLAFFIVLCSMAEDQTGANLHTGTGSFVRTLKAGGMPGAFSGDRSDRAVSLQATSPLYMASNETTDEPAREGTGPDENSNDIRSKDREQEEFMRFLNEVERHATVENAPVITGETAFDFFKRFKDVENLSEEYDGLLTRVVALLRKKSHRVEVIVWATTPSRSARLRAAKQAADFVSKLINDAGLEGDEANRAHGLSQTWPYKDVKRPVVTVVIRRVATE